MDANDINTTKEPDIIRFQKYLEVGDFHYQNNNIDSAIKNYFSALKIDQTHNILLYNTLYLFSSTKISSLNKKAMREICLFFLKCEKCLSSILFS